MSQKNRTEARRLMEKLGYGADKPLAVTVTTRNVPGYRDPAVILIDQLKEIYIDGVLDAVDTTQWYPKVMRKDYAVGLTVSENGLDDPDQQFMKISCAAPNATTPDIAARRSTSSSTSNRCSPTWRGASSWCGKSKGELAEDAARPIIFYPRSGACWQPQFKGHTMMINGNYNGWRLEDAWLDK